MQDFGAPRFELFLDGQPLNQLSLQHVLSIQIHESMEEMDALVLRIALPESESDLQSVLRLAQSFEAVLGYGDSEVRHIQGDIIELTYSYTTQDVRIATLRGLDKMNRLKQSKETKHWNISHHDIASELASKHGLTPRVEGVNVTATHEFQDNISDAAFLLELGRQHHYYVRVKDDALHFGRKTGHQGSSVLKWGERLIDLNLTQTLSEMYTEVTVTGWDYLAKRVVSGTSTASDLARYSGGKLGVELVQGYFGNVPLELSNQPYSSDSACKARAVAIHQESADRFVSGEAVLLGTPEIMSGSIVDFQGVGPRSGTYLVRATSHSLEPSLGYRTTLTLCSDSLTPEDASG